MGWNAGGFGHMTFVDDAARAAWHAATYHHGTWSDWEEWFTDGIAEPVAVSDQLATFRALHSPTQYCFLALDEAGPKLDFTFETGEDSFREQVADLAALLRSAAEHGASGRFYFLGTAGAEGDFVYQLELADGRSRIRALEQPDVESVYRGEDYQAFMNRVMDGLGLNELIAEVDAQVMDQIAPPIEPKPAPAKKARKPAPTKKPAAKKAAAKKPAAKKPAAKKPAAKKPAAKKPAAKKPAAKKPAAKKPAKPAKKRR